MIWDFIWIVVTTTLSGMMGLYFALYRGKKVKK